MFKTEHINMLNMWRCGHIFNFRYIFIFYSMYCTNIWDINRVFKAVFVLGENHFRKCFSGNEGIWLVRKIFSRNWFPLTQKKRLWLRKWISVPIFTSNEIWRERERERERERKREKHNQSAPFARPSSSRRRSQAPMPSIAIRDREHAFAPIVIGAVLRKIAPSIAISPSCRSRSTARSSNWSSRSTTPSNPVERRASIWMLCLFFWFCLFPCSIFQTPKNIFQKIFWNTIKHIKIFFFSEYNISEK